MLKLEPRATVDFETRSACSLKRSGSWRYSLDPSTEVLCLAFRLPYWQPGRVELWHPAFPHLGIEEASWGPVWELNRWILDGGLVEAHNAWFERGIWRNILAPQHGFPRIQSSQWRCSAAKAAAHSLPRGLDDASSAMALSIRKDMEGHALMRKMTSPRKPLKAEVVAWQNEHNAGTCPGCKGRGSTRKVQCVHCKGRGVLPGSLKKVPPMPVLWHEQPVQMERLWEYCKQDVLAEAAVSEALPDLSPAETDLYLLDQTINERGFYLDQEAVARALQLIADETQHLNQQIVELTDGKVTKGTQRQRMLEWFESQGLYLPDTKASTIDEWLGSKEQMSAKVRQGLTLLRELGRSSTAKYTTMRDWLCPDGRVHGGLLYHGAGTGRWSGAGVQPHNFVRGGSLKLSQDAIWQDLKTGDRDLMREAYGSVMLLLSEGLRGAICATPGHTLYVADYAAIEARVLLWMADDQDGLNVFRRGEDIYLDMAQHIYNMKLDKKKNPKERQLGKAAILGLGYQMGASKFVATAATYGVEIDEDFSTEVVQTYRNRFYRVKQMWWDQETAAVEAVLRPGYRIPCGKVTWLYTKPFLYCILPSGRRLAYPDPEVRQKDTPWGEKRPSLTYKGVNPFNHQWERQTTYGGKLVENIVQAVARDLMAEAMMRMEQSGLYKPVLSVHDELIAEAPIGTGNVREFEAMMAECPGWAKGCPVTAEGWAGERYHK